MITILRWWVWTGFCALLFIPGMAAQAACTAPAANAGTIIYNGASHVLQFCDGYTWKALGPVPGAGGAGCSSPTGSEGSIIYNNNTDIHVPQYCDGGTWKAMGLPVSGSSHNDCTSPAGKEGTIIYNGDHYIFQYCDGTPAWKPMGRYVSGTVPYVFGFMDQRTKNASTVITSNIVLITGFVGSVATSLSGTGSPQYRICSDVTCSSSPSWINAGTGSTIYSGQYAQLRLTSGATAGDARTATLVAGATSGNVWTVTVEPCGGSPAIGTVCDDGTVYAGLSSDVGTPKMYTTRCDMGSTWDGSTCVGYTFIKWAENGNTIVTGVNSTTTGFANTGTLFFLSNADSPYTAAVTCPFIGTGWYLPAADEMITLMTNYAAIGGFTVGPVGYWSSSESLAGNAATKAIAGLASSSSRIDLAKTNTTSFVRCVRHD